MFLLIIIVTISQTYYTKLTIAKKKINRYIITSVTIGSNTNWMNEWMNEWLNKWINNIKCKSDYIALKVYMHDINHNKASLIKKNHQY